MRVSLTHFGTQAKCVNSDQTASGSPHFLLERRFKMTNRHRTADNTMHSGGEELSGNSLYFCLHNY